MKTHKEILRKKWFRGSLITSLAVFLTVLLLFIFRDARLILVCIPFIIFARIKFPTKCYSCGNNLYIPPGTRALDNLNFCQFCGASLDSEIEIPGEEKIVLSTGSTDRRNRA